MSSDSFFMSEVSELVFHIRKNHLFDTYLKHYIKKIFNRIDLFTYI